MKYSPLSSIASLSLGIALALTSSLGFVSFAQSASDLDEGFQSNEANSTYGTDLGSSFNPMQLIHRMNLNNGVNQQEFSTESKQNINSAADDFKRQQQERMLNQSSTNETTTDTTTTDPNAVP
jgi:hypothetical protein